MADRARCIGLVMDTEDGRLYSSGYAHILAFPEFGNVDVTRTVLTLIEEVRAMQEIFDYARGEEPIHLVLGEDLGNQYLLPVSFVFTEIQIGSNRYNLSVIGPARLDYAYVIPMMKYFRTLIVEMIG
jgi:transcriptional regulator of heat shock response